MDRVRVLSFRVPRALKRNRLEKSSKSKEERVRSGIRLPVV